MLDAQAIIIAEWLSSDSRRGQEMARLSRPLKSKGSRLWHCSTEGLRRREFTEFRTLLIE